MAASPQSSNYQPRTTEGLYGFLGVLTPLIDDAMARLTDAWQEAQPNNQLFLRSDDLARMLLPSVEHALLHRICRTMTLEMNVARLEGRLEGGSPKERYRSFLSLLGDQGFALEILERYPVLAVLVIETLDAWRKTTLEFGNRLVSDRDEIFSSFGISGDATAVSLNGLAGDRHRGGRSVLVVEMSDGSRFVYKPRSLAVDAAFQALVDWINKRGNTPELPVISVLAEDNYGWQSFVEACSCSSDSEVEDFYRRQGGYLALLYALGGRDVHHENVIACGDCPVIVDLEALFAGAITEDSDDLHTCARQYLGHSVLGTGLLPFPHARDDVWGDLDVSGLGFVGGRASPYDVPRLVGAQTDVLSVKPGPVPLPHSDNLPKRHGRRATADQYLDQLTDGFSRTYDILLANREDLLSRGEPLDRFRTAETRIVLRSTRLYGRLLWESVHPSLLGDPGGRDGFLESLWSELSSLPELQCCVQSESDAIRMGDIPIFTHQPDSTAIKTADGSKIDGFFRKSGFRLAQERIKALDHRDRARQVWLIRTALSNGSSPFEPRDLVPGVDRPSTERLLQAAQTIAQEVADLAIETSQGVTWFGRTCLGGKRWVTAPLGPDFYEGLPGLALFFATIADIDSDQRWRSVADGAIAALLQLIRSAPEQCRTIGVYNGWSGVIYTLNHLASLLDRPDLVDQARRFQSMLPELIDADTNHDLISGSAGCIIGLLTQLEQNSGPEALDLACRCGERLLTTAIDTGDGLAWTSAVSPNAPLIGMSHGTAGIALALFRLGAATQEARFCEAARRALSHERAALQKLSEETLPTDDDHAEHGVPGLPSSWCHGWAGIGLSRIGLLGIEDDGLLIDEIERCCAAIRRRGIGRNASFCHGDMGKLELGVIAERYVDNRFWTEWETAALNSLLTEIESGQATLGHPKGTRSVGLMNGLAGAGYGLLRFAFPDRVPSVLLLDLPSRRHR